jgi:hypothetical protein
VLADVRLGDQCNVVRFDQDEPAIALLNYRDFFGEPFPLLIPRKTTTYSGVKATTCSMA